MPWTFNPFSSTFDQKGSGGGGSSYLEGEVQNFSALPTATPPAVDAAYLVREAEGAWLISRKPAGIYIRVATTGTRATDWTYAGEFPDVFSDANFLLYDESDSTKNLKFQLSGISTGTTRTLTAPNNSGTIALTTDAPSAHAASHQTGVAAKFSGQVAGMSENVTIFANNLGTAGNSITLSFDGTDDINTVLAAWNAANTLNTATLTDGNDAQVPDNAEEIVLSGGIASGSDAFGDLRLSSLNINGGEVEFGGSLSPYNLPFKVVSPDTGNTQVAQLLANNAKGFAIYGTGALSTDGPVVQATEYQVTNNVNCYVNPYGGNVIVGDTTSNGAKLQVGGNLTLKDLGGNQTATFDAQSNLTANRTYDLPDASGTLALQGAITTSGLTQSTARILGRTTASTGSIEEIQIGSGLSLSAGQLSATASSGGTKTYAVFTAVDNQPTASNFATLDTRGTGIAVLDFDDAATESAVFVGIMPEAASLGSGLIVNLDFMATTATSGNVRWSVAFERCTTDLDSDSFDTATAATVATSGTSGIVTSGSITCTSIDSIAAGDLFRVRVQRLGADAADTMTGDAELVAVEIRSAA